MDPSTLAGQPPSGGSVLINGRFLTRPATGVDRFASEVMRALRLAPNLLGNVQVASPRSVHPGVQAPHEDLKIQRCGRTSGHLWEQLELPGYAGDRFLMNLCNTGPLFRERQMVVIHDAATMATPSNYGKAFRLWYRTMIGQLMHHSRLVTTVSRFSADELVRHFGRPRNGIEVVPESGEHILRLPADRRILQRLGLEQGRFVLAVGSRARNKNLKATRAAMALLNDTGLNVVAVGASNQRVFAETGSDGINPIFTGYLTDPELRALYESAFCFVFPSLYEGFGLPPLEAMTCGCPVIVSDRASLPEVCAGGALYCDPDDPSTIAATVRSLLASKNLRDEMIAKGKQRAMTFNWASTAAQVASLVARH